jgi:hypothetical protein
MILAKVTPVTHSVGNCVKRVIVIVTSVLFFRTPVSTVNALGMAIFPFFSLAFFFSALSCAQQHTTLLLVYDLDAIVLRTPQWNAQGNFLNVQERVLH